MGANSIGSAGNPTPLISPARRLSTTCGSPPVFPSASQPQSFGVETSASCPVLYQYSSHYDFQGDCFPFCICNTANSGFRLLALWRQVISLHASPDPLLPTENSELTFSHHHFWPSNSITVQNRTFAPFKISSGFEYSAGAWLIPPTLGTKIIPHGANRPMLCASWLHR
jgi:hypothetical protein